MTAMTVNTPASATPAVASAGICRGPFNADTLAAFYQHFKAYDLPLKMTDTELGITFPDARISIRMGQSSLDFRIDAIDDLHLYQARETVAYLLDTVLPEAADRIDWNGAVARNVRPPNLQTAKVVDIFPVGAHFLRVVLNCENIDALMHGGMHFSLLIPPRGRAPKWPRINENGRTVWPDGDDTLHRAAYTFVHLDPVSGRLSFDIFQHEGGRMTEWSRTAAPGETVGVMGPGGGALPPGQHLLIAGDETALPAIRRILALSDPDRTGTAFIEVGDPGDIQPLEAPENITITWLVRGVDRGWRDAVMAMSLPMQGTDHFVWCAGKMASVRKVKSHFRDTAGLARSRGYFSGYWTDAP